MTKSFGFRADRGSTAHQPKHSVDVADAPMPDLAAFRRYDNRGSELSTQQPAPIRLDLEALDCFEVVDRQFQQLGVTFSNAIALHPSNPAYPAYTGTTVLMGSPKSGWLEATFTTPVRFVNALITSSRRTVLAAFDANNRPIGQVTSDGPNLAGSGSNIPPNISLSLKAADIHRITFQTFDGHITVGAFSFSV